MTKIPNFVLDDGGDAVAVGKRKLRDGCPVRVLVGGQWHSGELQLWRSPACVWVEALGHVALEDEEGLPCQVEALAASRNARRPAA